MTSSIGIKGFGRMGRLALRAGWGREGLTFVRVNEIATDASVAAHLLKFDAVHGTWQEDCRAAGDTLIVGEAEIACSAHPTIDGADWSDGDIAIESIGRHHERPETL